MKPVAVYTICNTMWVELYEYNGEITLTALCNIDHTDRPRRHQVYYTTAGRPYIRMLGSRYYLDEFMRV